MKTSFRICLCSVLALAAFSTSCEKTSAASQTPLGTYRQEVDACGRISPRAGDRLYIRRAYIVGERVYICQLTVVGVLSTGHVVLRLLQLEDESGDCRAISSDIYLQPGTEAVLADSSIYAYDREDRRYEIPVRTVNVRCDPIRPGDIVPWLLVESR